MKNILYILAGIIIFATACTQASSKGAQASFKVWGNCGMCKKTIESSLKVAGINKAEWNTKTKMMEVDYDTTQINLEQIHEKIAAVGYDTELKTGSDEAYNSLHSCCKYKRK